METSKRTDTVRILREARATALKARRQLARVDTDTAPRMGASEAFRESTRILRQAQRAYVIDPA